MLDDLLDIASMLPWWVGVLIAILSFFGLHSFALIEMPVTTQPGKIGDLLTAQFIKTFASIGQYLLPFIFTLGAFISFFRRKKHETLLHDTKQRGKQNALLEMSWREFEMLIGEVFRQRGFTVTELGGNGADGGVDLILKKNNETYFVQCKQWKAYKVGVQVVRELYGVMAAKGAVGGYVVTSGMFTGDAKTFVEGRNIELIDGNILMQWISGAKSFIKTEPLLSKETSNNSCPTCGSVMVRRVAHQGVNKGQAFLGCSRYPACRGTRAI
jgi:restriction system protein